MKRALTLIAAFAAVALLTVAAQAAPKGDQIFGQKCAMCHSVQGKGGRIGPELTTVAARLGDNELVEKIRNPKKSNPNSTMPSFKGLPKGELEALAGYLKTLK